MCSGPVMKTSWIAPLANTAPIGTAPLLIPLATVIRSGVTLKWVDANGEPRRQQHAGGAGDRLDDHCGDRRSVVQRDDPLEVVGELGAVLGQAARERVLLEVVGVAQVIDAADHGAEALAVAGDAADRDAAEVDAVVAALAADQARALALAAGAVIGDRHLERSVDGFRARVGE